MQRAPAAKAKRGNRHESKIPELQISPQREAEGFARSLDPEVCSEANPTETSNGVVTLAAQGKMKLETKIQRYIAFARFADSMLTLAMIAGFAVIAASWLAVILIPILDSISELLK